jgi:hypothetical protein
VSRGGPARLNAHGAAIAARSDVASCVSWLSSQITTPETRWRERQAAPRPEIEPAHSVRVGRVVGALSSVVGHHVEPVGLIAPPEPSPLEPQAASASAASRMASLAARLASLPSYIPRLAGLPSRASLSDPP